MTETGLYDFTAGRYLKAFGASLTGALGGALIWALVGLTGLYPFIAGYAIAYLAFLGYSFIIRNLTFKGLLINAFSIMIGFAIGQYIGLFVDLSMYFRDLTLMQYLKASPSMFSDIEVIGDLAPDLIFGLLFACAATFNAVTNNFKR